MSTLRNGLGALVPLALIIACLFATPQLQAQYTKKYVKHWISWNGVFVKESDVAIRKKVINRIKSEIAASSSKAVYGIEAIKGKLTDHIMKQEIKMGFKPSRVVLKTIVVSYCSRKDPLLWNISVDADVNPITDTTEITQPTVVPPKPKTVPSGEIIALLSQNSTIGITESIQTIVPDKPLTFSSPAIDDSAVIAILDTGIDTTLFMEGMRSEILWKGAAGSVNVLLNANRTNYGDDHASKHGTSVAALAVNSYYKTSDSSKVPQLMVVKVLDSSGSGSVFELCCGLSYATQNNATVINTSMGYFGPSNDVLALYVQKCKNRSIPVVAAAGNAVSGFTPGTECSDGINDNTKLRSPDYLFYPACLAGNNGSAVISVTGFKSPGVPCYFQNYSDEFVTMGVANTTTETLCCMYQLPFIDSRLALQGSSFATPVASGKLAYLVGRQGRRPNANAYVRMMQVTNAPVAAQMVTKDNQYITY